MPSVIGFVFRAFLLALVALTGHAKSSDEGKTSRGYTIVANGLWGPQLELDLAGGNTYNVGRIKALLPIQQSKSSLLAADLRMSMYGEGKAEDGLQEFNAGLMYRSLVSPKGAITVYGYLDNMSPKIAGAGHAYYMQVMGGIQFMSDYLDLQANFYSPLETLIEQDRGYVYQPTASGPIFSHSHTVGQAGSGLELELGSKAPLGRNFAAAGYLGVYNFMLAYQNENFLGKRARIELQYNDFLSGLSVHLGAMAQQDDQRGAQSFVFAKLGADFGRRRDPLNNFISRMPEFIRRDQVLNFVSQDIINMVTVRDYLANASFSNNGGYYRGPVNTPAVLSDALSAQQIVDSAGPGALILMDHQLLELGRTLELLPGQVLFGNGSTLANTNSNLLFPVVKLADKVQLYDVNVDNRRSTYSEAVSANNAQSISLDSVVIFSGQQGMGLSITNSSDVVLDSVSIEGNAAGSALYLSNINGLKVNNLSMVSPSDSPSFVMNDVQDGVISGVRINGPSTGVAINSSKVNMQDVALEGVSGYGFTVNDGSDIAVSRLSTAETMPSTFALVDVAGESSVAMENVSMSNNAIGRITKNNAPFTLSNLTSLRQNSAGPSLALSGGVSNISISNATFSTSAVNSAQDSFIEIALGDNYDNIALDNVDLVNWGVIVNVSDSPISNFSMTNSRVASSIFAYKTGILYLNGDAKAEHVFLDSNTLSSIGKGSKEASLITVNDAQGMAGSVNDARVTNNVLVGWNSIVGSSGAIDNVDIKDNKVYRLKKSVVGLQGENANVSNLVIQGNQYGNTLQVPALRVKGGESERSFDNILIADNMKGDAVLSLDAVANLTMNDLSITGSVGRQVDIVDSHDLTVNGLILNRSADYALNINGSNNIAVNNIRRHGITTSVAAGDVLISASNNVTLMEDPSKKVSVPIFSNIAGEPAALSIK